MAKSLDERIAEAEENARKLRARKADQERREDTRRKVLAGALLLHLAEQKGPTGEAARTLLCEHLTGFLKRSDDAALFANIVARAAGANVTITDREAITVSVEEPSPVEAF